MGSERSRIALFGVSRSGKDSTINGALATISTGIIHVSPIELVREVLGGRRLKDLSPEEKLMAVERSRYKIDEIRRTSEVITDDHYCFPVEYGGINVPNEYSEEKLPFVPVTDGVTGREYEVVMDEFGASGITAALYLKTPAKMVLERFRKSDGWKKNDSITEQEIADWQDFEIRSLKVLCRKLEIPFTIIEGKDAVKKLIRMLEE